MEVFTGISSESERHLIEYKAFDSNGLHVITWQAGKKTFDIREVEEEEIKEFSWDTVQSGDKIFFKRDREKDFKTGTVRTVHPFTAVGRVIKVLTDEGQELHLGEKLSWEIENV